ncbi:DUF1398 domain-containing protein [Flavobacterium terrae]|uniref:Uncharacterized conserved protein YbcV, DUF1398 family n=1 Tax=Flavobacterium terrae TaxID=415425 RepID=A0A1M6F525_9FLAO|nr:DUF1398 family protein [Flavobacterium terrae]SHI92807.1 Uncharacterized conserved protein YbcV, DUF1398 family [Flavobacterium terrae]
MFTIAQIKEAHSKVKSGADFPNYIKELVGLGVIGYETFVFDGHGVFEGSEQHKIHTESKYDDLVVSDFVNAEQFKSDLKAHQQGKTDYMTFCNDCAKSGIEKWVISMQKLTCTYFDKNGNELLQEIIPQ